MNSYMYYEIFGMMDDVNDEEKKKTSKSSFDWQEFEYGKKYANKKEIERRNNYEY